MTPMQHEIAKEARSQGFTKIRAGMHLGSISIGIGVRNAAGDELFASVTVTEREGLASIPRKVRQVRDEVDRLAA